MNSAIKAIITAEYSGKSENINMKTTDLKEILLNKINEKAKEDLNCEDIRTLCQAWSIIAGQENLKELSDYASISFSPIEN